MEVVQLTQSDMQDALALVWDVFREFEGADYTQEGIDTFRDFIRLDSITDKMKRGEILFWGCFMGPELAGVLAVRNQSHISLLFVRKEYQRRGIAKKLFRAAEMYCRKEDCKNITVHSSPYAVDIYRRLGFCALAPEQTANGIRYTPMEYTIL
jgi:Acetyltransferases